MSAHLLNDPIFGLLKLDPNVEPCLYCGEPLADTVSGVVLWHGAGAILALHQGCAEALAVRLIQDAQTVKLQAEQFLKLRLSDPQRNPARYTLTRRR